MKGKTMPFVTVRVFKDALTDEQKARIQTGITDIMTEVEGHGKEEFRQHVWVVIEEIEDKNWSTGGVPGSLELLKAFVES
jgi:4-oxalocrotonate tautomerase